VWRVFSVKERIIFTGAIALLVISGFLAFFYTLSQGTLVVPRQGGDYTEGIVGQPAFVNPILAHDGTPDKDLVKLIFANAYDIAESVKHSDDFRVWTLRIKEGALWHDGTPITSDDIIFTVRQIKSLETSSPIAADWQNIEPQRVSEREVRFEALNTYTLFENVLKELYPVPKKLFVNLSGQTMRLSSYNLEPVGSGPFAFKSLERRKDGFISSYVLTAAPTYATIGNEPLIQTFNVLFFENEDKLLASYNVGTIDGFGTYSADSIAQLKIPSTIRRIPSTKYYVAFFNQSANEALKSLAVREALSYATDKNAILANALGGEGIIGNGPLPKTFPFYNKNIDSLYSFNPTKAKDLLISDEWTLLEDSLWHKTILGQDTILSFIIKTPDIDPLKDVATQLQSQWEAVGVRVDVSSVDPTIISNETIRTRNYEILLFGNIWSATPDPYSFWHSSERFYPGLNLALYQNDSADRLINSLRQTDPAGNAYVDTIKELQLTIAQDYPALFLGSPYYLYIMKSTIPGISVDFITLPHHRFDTVSDWYVRTKRIFE